MLKNETNLVPELTIVMPCLNEAETIKTCITKAQRFLNANEVIGEIIIADNGSTDESQEIALRSGVKVIPIKTLGYGAAIKGGIAAARGKYVIFGDSDDSYDFTALMPFLDKLRQGFDLVMGNRFLGEIKPGSMPPLHYYLGNPILSRIGRLFFKAPCGDFHCGLRGFNKKAIEKLDLLTDGMEFASEMVVKAVLNGLRIAEVPIILYPDGRSKPPHLRSWRDGWRHLRFLLMYSPRWLFFYPGIIFMILGLIIGFWLLLPRDIGFTTLDIHTMLYCGVAILIGYQCIIFAVLTKMFSTTVGLAPPSRRLERLYSYFTLEIGLIAGGIMLLTGVLATLYAFLQWRSSAYGPQVPAHLMRIIIPAGILLTIGIETILASFFLSILGIKRQGCSDSKVNRKMKRINGE